MNRKERIEHLLNEQYSPLFLSVEDESHNHHVPDNAQTHYKVTLVTSQFAELARVQRHRSVNNLLKDEFALGMHALSMHLYSPEEWKTKKEAVVQSPSCRDGYKNK